VVKCSNLLISSLVLGAFLAVSAPLMATGGPDPMMIIVYEKNDDGSKGDRTYRDEFYGAATEERSSVFERCDIKFHQYDEQIKKLLEFEDGKHLFVVTKTTIDPVSKNSKRAELCRF